MEFAHVPVLLEQVLQGLDIKKDGTYVDGTLGGAGHSFHIVQKLSSNGKLIGIDRDTQALEASKQKLKDYSNIILYHGNHDDIKEILKKLEIENVDGILLDLGVSSYQLDEKSRGFSYMSNNRLDMRMNQEDIISAYEIINNYSEQKLIYIFKEYGEEKFAKKIASNIVLYRSKKKIETTKELVTVIEQVVSYNPKEGHVAKRVFQAVRIEVNGELKRLENTIKDAISLLKPEGRLAVITFHSLEDRIVKKAMEDKIGKCICPKDFPVCICHQKSEGKVITKKPIIATEEEITQNTRCKSAKLRIFQKS